jgi:hypothetical protein
VLREQATRERPDAHREQEGALIDRHHPAALCRRADVGQHDHADRLHPARADARHEARSHEFRKAAGERAPQVAQRADQPAQRHRLAPPQ